MAPDLASPTEGRVASSDSHPIWTVYDRLRSARLSVKYYGRRLSLFETTNFWFELTLLISAPTSAVAGLWFWQSEVGQIIWQYLGVIAAGAAMLKPAMHLSKRIKEYESILTGYRTLEYDLMNLKSMIEQKQKYDAPLQSEFRRILQRERALIGKTPESTESKRTKRVCQAEVIRELPSEAFFIPQE